jgi:hypothetical protein
MSEEQESIFSNRVATNIDYRIDVDYKGIACYIHVNWNDWDDYCIDQFEYEDDEPENKEEFEKEVTEKFHEEYY